MANKNEAARVLIMDRGTLGDGKRLLAGEGFSIGDEVSPETAEQMVKRGRGHYADKKPAKAKAKADTVD